MMIKIHILIKNKGAYALYVKKRPPIRKQQYLGTIATLGELNLSRNSKNAKLARRFRSF